MCGFISATLVAQQGRPYVSSLIAQVSADSLVQHVAELSDAGGWKSRMNFTPGNDSARKYIERQLQSRLRISVERDSFFVLAIQPFDAQPLMNVAGELNGGVENDIVVVGAHYDSQAGRESDWQNNWQSMSAPGADDNASGVAGVLEIARVLSANWDSTMMRGSVLFAFFAAEEGTTPGYASYLNGSRHLAQRLRQEGRTVRAMVNLDMIGYNQYFQYGEIVADSQSVWLGDLVRSTVGTYAVDLMLPGPPYSANRWSDHASFWDQSIPAILLIESANVGASSTYYMANPHYHRSSDTVGTINGNLMRAFTQATLATVLELVLDTSAVTRVEETGENDGRESVTLDSYPNPFNGETVVEFRLDREQHVDLRIYDLVGREIAVLSEGLQPRGIRRIRWNAQERASGLYVAVLRHAEETATRMLLYVR